MEIPGRKKVLVSVSVSADGGASLCDTDNKLVFQGEAPPPALKSLGRASAPRNPAVQRGDGRQMDLLYRPIRHSGGKNQGIVRLLVCKYRLV